jgi:hypothetical protein
MDPGKIVSVRLTQEKIREEAENFRDNNISFLYLLYG